VNKKFFNSLARQFRKRWFSTEIFLQDDEQLKKQLSYANKKKIEFVVIVNGEDLVIKNMFRGVQEIFKKDNFEQICNFLS
jgi:histidyl-tRNA synthetase